MYRLSLFGSASLSGPSGPLDGRVSQRRPVALLSLLAASEGGRLSRDKLVAYLWPETESSRARHLLSVTLHAIRKALGKASILSVGDDLRLNPEVVEADVRTFEAALGVGDRKRAVELYTGPFLDGFHVSGAPAFERWVEGERRRLAGRYAEALEGLAEAAEAAEAWRAAVGWWKERAAHDPCSSRVALRLMAALERAGDRPAAVRHARAHGERVREALGVEPDPEVSALAERLENGEVEREGAVPHGAEAVSPRAAGLGAGAAGEEAPTSASAERPHRFFSRLGWPAWLAGAALVLVLLLAGSHPLPSSPESALDANRVLVDVFESRAGDPALEELGRMAADWVTQGLTYTGFVEVVTRGRPILAGQAAEMGEVGAGVSGERLERLARANGTGTVVWGRVYRAGDSVYFQAHVTDAADRRELASLEPVAAAVGAPVPGLERLRDRVMAALATLTDPRLEKWQRHASKPPSFDAYQTFVEGLELGVTHRRWREAAERFREAADLDPGFTMARLWEAMALGNSGRWDEVDSILRELEERRERLAQLDRAFLDYQSARREWRLEDGDPMAMLRATRRMVEIAPGSEYLKLAGQVALLADRPAEAVRHYERADPESGWLRGWTPYWPRLARAHLEVGNPERALEVARRARAVHPDVRDMVSLEAQVLSRLGRIEEMEEAVREAEKVGHAAGAWVVLARAHLEEGNVERALRAVRAGRASYPDDAGLRKWEMHCLGVLGRVEELEEVAAELTTLEGVAEGRALRTAAEELVTHGRPEAGREYFRKAIRWERKRLAEAEGGADARSRRTTLVRMLGDVGDLSEAEGELAPLLAEHPDDPGVLKEAAILRARQGRREEALELFHRADRQTHEVAPYVCRVSDIFAALGERERAVEHLRECDEQFGIYRPYFRHAATWWSLQDYPPFQELVRAKPQ